MSFHLNNAQQMALDDSLLSLTERERKHLNNSWAETFSKKIFPFIREDRFSVLYSDNPASRPNNPINVYFGLLILREVFNQSDEEALNSLMFDIRYQRTSYYQLPRTTCLRAYTHRQAGIQKQPDQLCKCQALFPSLR